MARSSTTLKKGDKLENTRGPSKKLAMLCAIEKQFPGGAQDFCEEVLRVGLNGGPEGMPVPALLSECLKRIEPPLKPQGTLISIDMPEGASKLKQTEVVLGAVFTGSITADTGNMLIGMIKDSLAIQESTELIERLEKIEELLKAK